ncbi:hypothetical protein CB0940_06853 [Cercospora beticola]|uniref:Uncharacterized protein n=1 Tax=Cercospora beticola TaxID=122368 RepID=A0A2G5H886_CERBT|nr:hypothetical protein CB0940_06853 [Cercospora beticola]PIA88523.1 hypothetical protein CB0940_06853 [Cercospora beticola]WPB02769.1 hypothetical protein RHO25_007405 [Cercospora beticola]
MATVRRYTREELIALSSSKLVSRPDNLPAIEQWIDEQPQPANHERHKSNDGALGKGRQTRGGLAGAAAAEGSPMGAFSTGRPTLTSRGSTLRNASGDDVSLGPPRNMFPSSRNVSKLSDFHDKNGTDAANSDEPDSMRSRFFSDRQLNRRGPEKDGADTKDRWSGVRERRQQGEFEDEKRSFGRHDKDNDGERRNGYGHKDDPRWSREDRPNGNRTGGGWREREAARRDRDHYEKEPEWMDDPVVKKDQELGFTARTQDDFEEWKRQMAGKPKVEKEEAAITEPASVPAAVEVKPTLKLDGFEGGLFGGFGAAAAITTPGTITPSAATASSGIKAPGKGKTSRFASMFKPAEPTPPPAPVEEPQPPPAANGSKTAEDQEGFNRVLAMLGGTKINQAPSAPESSRDLTPSYAEPVPTSPPPPPKSMTSGGTLPGGRKSRFTDMFAQDKNPERLQSPQQSSPPLPGDSVMANSHSSLSDGPNQILSNKQPERQPSHSQLARTQAPESTMSPEPTGIPFNALREQQPRPTSGRPSDLYNRFDPPSRGAASPDRNIQDLLAQQPRHRPQTTSSQSQDLLNLLKNPKPSRPSSQQAIPSNGGIDQVELERWLQQQQPLQPQGPIQTFAPKPRGPQQPPGLFEEQLMRNYGPEQQRHEQMQQLQERPQPRAPPGFYNPEQEAMLAQQQRQAHQQAQQQAEREAQQAQLRRQQQYAELAQRQQIQQQQQQQQQQQPPRRMSGHPALQQMHIPQQHSQPDFHQLTSPVGGGAPPPPGFNQMPRYPPGFASVNTFPQQREQAPPGFNAGPMSPPGFFGGPPNLPPGFHAQQIRSPTEVPGRRPFDEALYARR